MEPNIKEIVSRVRALREDLGLTMQEMAEATGRSVAEYAAQESGEQDLSFTFLYRCAEKFGVDVVDILTGESPHLTGYSLVRKGEGLSVKRYEGFEYLHKAPSFRNKLCEPFVVTIPYSDEEAGLPMEDIHLSFHEVAVCASSTTESMSRSLPQATSSSMTADAATAWSPSAASRASFWHP